MVRKRKAIVAFGLIVIAMIGMLVYYLFQLQQGPRVYNLTVETEDFRIKDIEFVTYADSLYITDHQLEVVGEWKHFSGVSYGLSIDGTWIMSLSQGDDPFTLPHSFEGKVNYKTGNMFEGIKVREQDTVEIKVVYEVDGVSKSLSREVKLSEILKSSSAPNEVNLVSL